MTGTTARTARRTGTARSGAATPRVAAAGWTAGGYGSFLEFPEFDVPPDLELALREPFLARRLERRGVAGFDLVDGADHHLDERLRRKAAERVDLAAGDLVCQLDVQLADLLPAEERVG